MSPPRQPVPDGMDKSKESAIASNVARSAKPVAMPAVRSFSELFESASPVGDLIGYRSRTVKEWRVDAAGRNGTVRRGAGRATVSSFCPVTSVGSGRRSHLDVVPRPELIGFVGENMLLADGYSVSFEVTVYEDGTALVSARYNAISGCRWVAFVDADTVPGVGSALRHVAEDEGENEC